MTEAPSALAIYLYGFTLPDSVAAPISGVDDEHLISTHQCAGLVGLYRQHCAALDVFNGCQIYLLSYLVPRKQLSAFCERLNALTDSSADLGFISGPWPPYNFAG